MATSKQSKKRIRQNAEDRLRNRSAKSALRTTIKKFKSAVKSGDADAATTGYKDVQKQVDKTAAKGIIRKGTAARIKSRLNSQAKAATGDKKAAE